MTVIDLDSPVRAAPAQGARRRVLGVVAVALLVLFGPSGEVKRGSGFLDEAICDYLNRLPAGATGSRVLIDERSGEVQQTTTISGDSCVTRTGG
ncbi:hypothetical protein [Paractinoplanes atraurantiacus]|uniref:Uncharacterized protein n=1 Tax=Paractinoplanes atraurantiacus TaxID=1036182 RepID=A0A285IJP7_9ACTN|nr:hypothetical protein [Actinoplanes atraurantiacus]SNY48123.1 hypothetical protein SAMN05421748_108297 [Actinoplanes atraurantiacus]